MFGNASAGFRLGSGEWVGGLDSVGLAGLLALSELEAVEVAIVAAQDVADADDIVGDEGAGASDLPGDLRLGLLPIELIEARGEGEGMNGSGEVVRLE